MSLVERARRKLDRKRARVGQVDPLLRPYSVTMVVTIWSGLKVGQGTKVSTRTVPLLVDGYNPMVEQIETRTAMALPAVYETEDLIVTLTQAYPGCEGGPGAGYAYSDLIPPRDPAGIQEIVFKVTSPAHPEGATYKRQALKAPGSLSWKLHLRKIGSS